MNRKNILSAVLYLCCGLTACIKDEPLSPEADIEAFYIDSSWLEGDVFIDQPERKILLYLKNEAYKNGVVPEIKTSEGAMVSPASGDSLHFHSQIFYTVTSANGVNQKVYEVITVSEIS